MLDTSKEKFECMFSNAEAACYAILINSYGLRDTRLTDLPYNARIGIADLEEHACRAVLSHLLGIDNNNESSNEETIVALVKEH